MVHVSGEYLTASIHFRLMLGEEHSIMIITDRVRSTGKVMLSRVFVCAQGREGGFDSPYAS